MAPGAAIWSVAPGLACMQPAMAGAQAVADGPYVDPELRAMMPALQQATEAMGRPTLAGLAAARKAQSFAPPLGQPAWAERLIAGPGGSELRVLVINAKPAAGASRPAILHTHGGGFISGSVEAGLRALQEMAAELNCTVVSVDYRLAPETRFPGALEDNYAALKWLHTHAPELGADPARIALLGESAGGGHAAMLALAARDRGEIAVKFQALVYPMLDDRTASTRPALENTGQVLWTAELNRFGWTGLLGVPAGSAKVPDGAVPARVDNLRHLPPTFIAVGTMDLFVREDIEYARRLIEAGVPTELQVIPGAFHAFDVVAPDAAVSKKFRRSLLDALARGLK